MERNTIECTSANDFLSLKVNDSEIRALLLVNDAKRFGLSHSWRWKSLFHFQAS